MGAAGRPSREADRSCAQRQRDRSPALRAWNGLEDSNTGGARKRGSARIAAHLCGRAGPCAGWRGKVEGGEKGGRERGSQVGRVRAVVGARVRAPRFEMVEAFDSGD